MYCRNLPIIKNKLLNKFAPKIAGMKKSYYMIIVMSLFALGMILITKYGFRGIGLVLMILFAIGFFLEDSLDEMVQNHERMESSGFLWRMHCIILIHINIVTSILIVVLIVEVMK